MITTTTEQIQELSAALDRDVTNAEDRIKAAEENLRIAQEECKAAKRAGIDVQQQREGFRRTFAKVLGIEEHDNTDTELEPEPPRQSPLQLVNTVEKAAKVKAELKPKTTDIAEMTLSAQVKHILGNQVMTLDEIRAELKARKLSIPNLSNILSTTKHKVLDADGNQRRDPKNGDPIRRNTFNSPSRGSWCVAEADTQSEVPTVLTRTEVQAEMLSNQMGRPSSRAFSPAIVTRK